MRKTSIFISILCAVFLGACSEQEVETFHAERGINFVNYTPSGDEYTDNYQKLSNEVNFFTKYAGKSGWDLQPDTIYAGLQIEGTIPDTLVRVRLKVMPVEGNELADISVPEEVDIHSGQYHAPIQIVCRPPKEYDKQYKAKIVVDYANSDVVAGTSERQEYMVTVSDSTIWSDLRVTSEATYNDNYAKYTGNYGPKKTRFIFVTFGQSGPVNGTYRQLCEAIFYYGLMGWGGLSNSFYQQYLNQALGTYNQTHDTPLTEPDGTVVKFNF